jgi:hypothetical protein
MAWFSLIATALGAVIAFSGSTLSDGLRSRRELTRSQLEARHQVTVDFIMSINNAHELLRDVASQSIEISELPDAARKAIKDSGLYTTREQMLISVSPEVALAAEAAFHSIIAVRDAVSADGNLDSSSYRQANRVFDQKIWALRQATRKGFGASPLDVDQVRGARETIRPETLGRPGHHPG